MVGDNYNGTISNSYSLGDASGSEEVGGLVGVNQDEGKILTSYSTGQPSGEEDVGGLVGVNGAEIENSYWDKDSSSKEEGVGRGPSDGAMGLSAEEMTGAAAEDNMPRFDFTEIWETIDASSEDAEFDAHPILQPLDRQKQIDAQNHP